MEQREKLIELVVKALDAPRFRNKRGCFLTPEENVADYLLEHGVVVLPCRCGECEYYNSGKEICGRQVCMSSHFNGFCDFAKRKGGGE